MYIYTKNKTYLKLICLAAFLCLIFSGCAKKAPSEKTALKINDYTLTPSEFNELFMELSGAEDTPQERAAFLENMINRKILLQEAQRQGLDKQKEFLKAIENFWEQSLLTIIVDKKTKEISGSITVTEEEIQEYYGKLVRMHPEIALDLNYVLRNSIRLQILKKKQAEAINSWSDSLKNKASINIDKKALGIE